MLKTLAEIDKKLVEKKASLEVLFGVSFDEILVMVLPKEDFLKLKTEGWVVAFTFPRSKIVFVMDQEESGRNREEWLKVIVHEMVHLFYYKKFRSSEPKWLFEGLACYLADQKKEGKFKIDDLIRTFPESYKGEDIYPIGYAAVNAMLTRK